MNNLAAIKVNCEIKIATYAPCRQLFIILCIHVVVTCSHSVAQYSCVLHVHDILTTYMIHKFNVLHVTAPVLHSISFLLN